MKLAAMFLLVGFSGEPHALYVIDGVGRTHFLEQGVDEQSCWIGAHAAERNWPSDVQLEMGPPPWRFECRPESRFAPGWDLLNGKRR